MRPTSRFFVGLVARYCLVGLVVGQDGPLAGLEEHLRTAGKESAFVFDPRDYRSGEEKRSTYPIGVFDSGIGGLTVLEALFAADNFDNKTLQPRPDGKPDFEDERFIYLGDQANMPYGNYSKVGKTDYLRELILKDGVFLLGDRYRAEADQAPRHDKPPVKAIVIACNTATAYGLEDLRAAMGAWDLPVPVIGVVEAGARGLLESNQENPGAIGVLATVGTCSSGVYPRTIQSVLGRAGRGLAVVTQHGSTDLAAVIEGESGVGLPMDKQIVADVRALVEARKEEGDPAAPVPIRKIMLGCTHFPLVRNGIEAAFAELADDPALAPWISEERIYVDPADWTARLLFQELAREGIRCRDGGGRPVRHDLFFLSVPNPASSDAIVAPGGGLDYDYKYGRNPGDFDTEDTVFVPMTRALLPETGRKLVREKLPLVWERLPAGEPEEIDGTPVVTAASWAIADGATGELLWGYRADARMKTASITKTMCALVALEIAEKDPAVLDERIVFSDVADRVGGSTSELVEGEGVSLRSALYGLMLPSGNDMGVAIAEHFHPRLDPPDSGMRAKHSGKAIPAGRENFLAEMNRLAERIGMEGTYYSAPFGDGGESAGPTSTAADLCLLAHRAMANPILAEIVGTQRFVAEVSRPDGSVREQVWVNTNDLLSLDRGYSGIKTGTTVSAGHCLLATGERNGRRLHVVVLGASGNSGRVADARNLFRFGWRQLESAP